MQAKPNTVRNYLYNVICELVTTLIPLLTMPYVTRVLGVGGLGSYQYVQTVASYFVLFANCGVKAYGNRCIAAAKDDPDRRNRVFSGIFSQQALLSLLVGAVYLCVALNADADYRMIFAVFGINMVSALLEISWLYWGMEQFAPIALCTIAAKVAVAAGIFLLVRDEGDLLLYALLCSLGVIAVQLYLWTGVRKFVRFVRVPFAEIRTHFLPCLALLIPMIAPTLFRSMDKLMLERYTTTAASVGLYGAAEQLQTCMLGFITGLGTVMLPRISNLLANGHDDDARRYIGTSMQFSVFIGAAFAFGIAAVSDVFVPYYYGADYTQASILTLVLSPTILMIAWADVIRAQYIIPHKRDRIFVVSVLIGAAVNLIANAVLIPLFSANHTLFALTPDAAGALGALPGTLAAELAVLLVQYLWLRHALPFGAYLRSTALFFVAGCVMFVCVRLIGILLAGLSPLPLLLLEVLAGGFVYLLIVGLWYFCFRRETLAGLLRK